MEERNSIQTDTAEAQVKDMPPVKYKNKKKSILKFTLVLVGIVLAVFLITAFILFSMLTDQTHNNKFTAAASTQYINTIIQSVATGNELELPEEQLNQLIMAGLETANKQLEKNTEPESAANIDFSAGAVTILDNNKCDLYIKAVYNNIDFIIRANVTLNLKEDKSGINIVFNETYIGSLPIPPDITMDYIALADQFQPYTDSIRFYNSSVTIPAEYVLPVDEIDYEFILKLERLETQEGKIILQTNSMMDQISDYLGKWFSDLIN